MRTISVRLDDQTDAALMAHCQRHGLTQTAAIKLAIEQLAALHRPTPAQLAAELGLIGGIHSGVPDMARNRAQYIKERLLAQRAHDSLPPARPHAAVKSSGAAKPPRGPVAA